jgi:GH24 family phage-related lysozyme (muramidase)
VRFYNAVKRILEAVGDVPPPAEPPPAIIQRAVDTKLTFDDVYAFIKDHEGYRPHVYNDSRGIPTIGIGLNLLRPDAKKIAAQAGADYDAILSGKQTLTDDQVKDIFRITLGIAHQDAKKWVPQFDSLPKNIKLGILDLSFNLGYTRLSKFVKTKEHIASGNYNSAADELQKSKWATQVGRRAQSIIKLFSAV